jgi:hypothetical protein
MLENRTEAIPNSFVIHSGKIMKKGRWDGAGKVIDLAVPKTGPEQVQLDLRVIHLRNQRMGSLYIGQPPCQGRFDERGIADRGSQDTSPVTAHERQIRRV